MTNLFFDNWQVLLRTLIIGVLAYTALIVLLRASGKRTLSKMNAFDLIVTVALGSTLASSLTSKQVSLAQGVLALALLIGLQFVITWTSIRVRWVRNVVTGEPVLLMYQGRPLEAAMRRERITHSELQAACRESGLASLEDADAVVMETDGSLTVIAKTDVAGPRQIAGVRLPKEIKSGALGGSEPRGKIASD